MKKLNARFIGRLLVAALILLLALLMVTGVILSRSEGARIGLLNRLLSNYQFIPGRVETGRISWPHLGQLTLTGVLWHNQEDTLFQADTLSISCKLGQLWHRQLDLEWFVLDRFGLNLVALQRAFPPAVEPDRSAGKRDGGSFLKPGSLPGVPSIRLNALRICRGVIVLSDSNSLALDRLSAVVDLRQGELPLIGIDTVRIADFGDQWALELFQLLVDPARMRLSGHGSGSVGSQLQVELQLLEQGPDSLAVAISTRGSIASDSRLQLGFLHDHQVIKGLSLAGSGSVELFSWLQRYHLFDSPEYEPSLSCHLQGQVVWGQEQSLSLRLETDPHSWLNHFTAALHQQAGDLTLEALEVELPEFQLHADGTMRNDQLAANVRLTARGPLWLQPILADPLPGSMHLEVHGAIQGTLDSPQITLDLTADGSWRDYHLEQLHLVAAPSADGHTDFRLHLSALDMSLAAAGLWAERSIRFDTLTLNTAAGPSTDQVGGGIVRFSENWKSLQLERLQLTGDAGIWDLNGTIPPLGSDRLLLTWRAEATPPLLEQLLRIQVPPASWQPETFCGITWSTETGGRQIIECDYRLPAAGLLLPAGITADGWGSLIGDLLLEAQSESGNWLWHAELNATADGWIDQLRVLSRSNGRGLHLDILRLASPGALLLAQGSLVEGKVDLNTQVTVGSPGLPEQLWQGLEEIHYQLQASAEISGDVADPAITALLTGEADADAWRIGDLAGDLQWRDSQLDAVLTARGNVGLLPLDSLAVTLASADDRLLLHDLHIKSNTLSIRERGRIRPGGDLQLFIDSLWLQAGDGWLALRDTLLLSVQNGVTELSPLELTGSLGELTLSFYRNEPIARFSLSGELRNLNQLPIAGHYSGLLPEALQLDVNTENDQLKATVYLQQLFSQFSPLDLAVELYRSGDLFQADLAGFCDSGQVLQGHLNSELQHLCCPEVRISLREFPLPLEQFNRVLLEGGSRLNGDIVMFPADSGCGMATRLFLDPAAAGPLRDHHLTLTLGNVSQIQTTDTSWNVNNEHPFLFGTSGLDNLAGDWLLDRSGDSLAWGDLRLPLRFIRDCGAELDSTRELSVNIAAANLALKEVGPFLPADSWLNGKLNLQIQIHGYPDQLHYAGKISAQHVKLSRVDGTRLFVDTDLSLTEQAQQPRFVGRIEIPGGVVMLPETPRSLHAVTGQTVLWDLQKTNAARIPIQKRNSTVQVLDSTGLDLKLRIPNGLRLRSAELDLMLEGDLVVMGTVTDPEIQGQLSVRKGTLYLLRRTFLVKSGRAEFLGTDKIDPWLELQLETIVENTRVMVELSGYLERPKLQLSADPPLEESDIMALLLFGSTHENLDDSQEELLQRESSELALRYALGRFETRLSRRLGMDMIRYEQQSSGGGKSALMIGKYLGPRVLLKMEQPLDHRSLYRLNLEYRLFSHLQLESTYSRNSGSGVEVVWKLDY